MKNIALALYKAPFQYVRGYIYDANFNVVSDNSEQDPIQRVRGWGKLCYIPDGAKIQDTIGEMIAEALTEYWYKNMQTLVVVKEKTLEDKLLEDMGRNQFMYFDEVIESLKKHGVDNILIEYFYYYFCVSPSGKNRWTPSEVASILLSLSDE